MLVAGQLQHFSMVYGLCAVRRSWVLSWLLMNRTAVSMSWVLMIGVPLRNTVYMYDLLVWVLLSDCLFIVCSAGHNCNCLLNPSHLTCSTRLSDLVFQLMTLLLASGVWPASSSLLSLSQTMLQAFDSMIVWARVKHMSIVRRLFNNCNIENLQQITQFHQSSFNWCSWLFRVVVQMIDQQSDRV